MADSAKPVSDSSTQIWLAIIGAISALGVAIIANWKTLFPQPPLPEVVQPVAKLPATQPAQPTKPQVVPQTLPAATIKATTVYLSTSEFTNGSGVAMATGEVAKYGNVLMNGGPPYADRPNSAEFHFRVPVAGTYQVWAEYAAAVPRPVRVDVNGKLFTSNGLSASTGCWEAGCQQVLNQGEVNLNAGANMLRISRDSVFPHIKAFKFVPIE
jgi:hypothetical protein